MQAVGTINVFYPQLIGRVRKKPDNSVLVDETVHVSSCSFNEPIDDSVFTINFSEAQSIWDIDNRRFVAERGGLQAPQKIEGIPSGTVADEPLAALSSDPSHAVGSKSAWAWGLIALSVVGVTGAITFLVKAMRSSRTPLTKGDQ